MKISDRNFGVSCLKSNSCTTKAQIIKHKTTMEPEETVDPRVGYTTTIREIKHVKIGEKLNYPDDRRVYSGVAPGIDFEVTRDNFSSLLTACEAANQKPVYGMASMAHLEKIEFENCVGCGKKVLTYDEEQAEAKRIIEEAAQRKEEKENFISDISTLRTDLKKAKRSENEYKIRLNELRIHYDQTEDARKKLQGDMKEVILRNAAYIYHPFSSKHIYIYTFSTCLNFF